MNGLQGWFESTFFDGPSLYRVRLVIESLHGCVLPLLHSPIIYALLCEANAHVTQRAPAMPEGVLPEVVERSVTALDSHDQYALGLTIIGGSGREANERVRGLIAGLRCVGENPKADSLAISRFKVIQCTDLVAGRPVSSEPLERVDCGPIAAQIDQVMQSGSATLRFDSPLRTVRPAEERRPGHAFFDGEYFNAGVFIDRVVGRLETLGFSVLAARQSASIVASNNRLIWMDTRYGWRKGKTLGGSLGTITLHQVNERDAWALALGQFVHAGENTRFGFGRYEILRSETDSPRAESIGDVRLRCGRASSLMSRLLHRDRVNMYAKKYQIDRACLSDAVRDAQAGEYACEEFTRLSVGSSDKTQYLSIPSQRDLAFQDLLCDGLARPLKLCVQQMLGTHDGRLLREAEVKQLKAVKRDGYRWAVAVDLLSYLGEMEHVRLRSKLEGYLGDQVLVNLIMQFVTSAAPKDGMGLVAGCTLFEILAPFCIHVAEKAIEAGGGISVHRGEKLKVITKSESCAKEVLDVAESDAREMVLKLNAAEIEPVGAARIRFRGGELIHGDTWVWCDERKPIAV